MDFNYYLCVIPAALVITFTIYYFQQRAKGIAQQRKDKEK